MDRCSWKRKEWLSPSPSCPCRYATSPQTCSWLPYWSSRYIPGRSIDRGPPRRYVNCTVTYNDLCIHRWIWLRKHGRFGARCYFPVLEYSDILAVELRGARFLTGGFGQVSVAVIGIHIWCSGLIVVCIGDLLGLVWPCVWHIGMTEAIRISREKPAVLVLMSFEYIICYRRLLTMDGADVPWCVTSICLEWDVRTVKDMLAYDHLHVSVMEIVSIGSPVARLHQEIVHHICICKRRDIVNW